MPHRAESSSLRPRRGIQGPIRAASAVLLSLTVGSLMAGCAIVDEEFDEVQRRPLVGEGGRVVGLSGSYAYREDEQEEREWFAARATIDEYLTDNHVVGAYALGQFSNEEDDPDGREQIWAGVHYHYHLHLSKRTSIYGGPTVGYAFFDDETRNESTVTYGLSAGFQHWLTERTAFTIEPTFLRANFDNDAGGNSDELLILWGLAFSL